MNWPILGNPGWGLMQMFIFIWKPDTTCLCLTVSNQGYLFSMTAEKVQMTDRWLDNWWMDGWMGWWIDRWTGRVTHGDKRNDLGFTLGKLESMVFKPLKAHNHLENLLETQKNRTMGPTPQRF